MGYLYYRYMLLIGGQKGIEMLEKDLIKEIDKALENFKNDKVTETYCYSNTCKDKCYKHISNKYEVIK